MNPTRLLIVPVIFILCLTLTSCSDSETSVVTPPPPDTAPPAVPTGLATCAGDCVVKISWDPNVVDSDFRGFNVYRLNAEESWDLTAEPIATSTFVDTSPLTSQCIYRVTSVDFTGNESAWAETIYICNYTEDDMHRP